MNLARNLSFSRAAVVFPSHADNPTSIDDIVRRIQHPGKLQRCAILFLRELVIGRPRNHTRSNERNRLRIENRAQRTRCQHVHFLGQNGLHRHGQRIEFVVGTLRGGRPHIGDAQLYAFGC